MLKLDYWTGYLDLVHLVTGSYPLLMSVWYGMVSMYVSPLRIMCNKIQQNSKFEHQMIAIHDVIITKACMSCHNPFF